MTGHYMTRIRVAMLLCNLCMSISAPQAVDQNGLMFDPNAYPVGERTFIALLGDDLSLVDIV